MTWFRLLRPALASFVVQGAAAAGVWATSRATYGGSPSLAPGVGLACFLAALAVGGLVGGGIALRGIHRLHGTRGPLAAGLVTLVVYAPLVFAAALQTYTLAWCVFPW